MPVSFSQSGPEKFFGSSDCRPASQTMLMVVPLYCCAALTAVSAALCALAACDQAARARPATAPAQVIFLTRLIAPSQCLARRACARRDRAALSVRRDSPLKPRRRLLSAVASLERLQPR